MYKRILVPLDGSSFASHALESAYEIAESFNSDIILLRVVSPVRPVAIANGTSPFIESPQSVKISMNIARAEEKRNVERARRYLREKSKTGSCSALKCTYQVKIGQPANEILKLARVEKADLIVLSTHGRGGIKRAILGSVADEVVRKFTGKVLIVHPYSRRRK
ncbi:MAG: universal stress protein [Dehalococcoidales bacterium]|nr:universal stress protein [Dehalococcoidales bacterium]